MIYDTWLDVNFLHHIKDLSDYVCELCEAELEADRNTAWTAAAFSWTWRCVKMRLLKTQGTLRTVRWSMTFSDDDVYDNV